MHVFDCAITFRKQYDYCYEWESKVGVPKAGFDVDGHKIEDTPIVEQRVSAEETKAE